MSLFNTIILFASNQLKDERTDQAIYHILQGKKSIQTIQDTYLYQLSKYYGILPTLKQTYFKQIVQDLVKEGYMKPSQTYEHSYTVTKEGRQAIDTNAFPTIMSHLDGKKYSAHAEQFEKRILLFVQVLSNKQALNNEYVPIIEDYFIKNDIKHIFSKLQASSSILSQQFYKECRDILSSIDEEYARLFVQRLSGYNHYGMSLQQLAQKLRMSEVDILILYRSIIHYMLEQIRLYESDYPLLSLLYSKEDDTQLTITARQTKQLVSRGYSLEQIAARRNLKMNTIFDHIVEIALVDDSFLIDRFIDENQIATILQTVQSLQTYQLKELKEALGEDYSYFQIRLALARGGTMDG